jgi:O-antigen ligase
MWASFRQRMVPGLAVITGLLLCCLLACAINVEHGASAPFTLLVLLALAVLPWLPQRFRLHADEQWLLLIALGFLLWAVISMYLARVDHEALKRIVTYSRLLTAVPVYYLLRRLQPPAHWLHAGAIAGAMFAGLYAIGQTWFGLANAYPGRASGAFHPVYFGDFATLLAFLTLIMLPLWPRRAVLVFSLAGFVLGMVASVLSGTRGAWLAVPVLLAVLLAQYWRRGISHRVRVVLVLLLVTPVLLYFIPQTDIANRIDDAVKEIMQYDSGVKTETSLGMRLEMWRAALDIATRSPLTGAGTGSYQREIRALVADGDYDASILSFGNPHNEYLNVLATRGLVGLIGLLALLLWPLGSFMRQRKHADPVIRALAHAGIAVIAAFSVFSLSAAPFERATPITLFIVPVFSLHALLYARLEARGDNR